MKQIIPTFLASILLGITVSGCANEDHGRANVVQDPQKQAADLDKRTDIPPAQKEMIKKLHQGNGKEPKKLPNPDGN